jgi:hypothetical protein
VLGEEDRKPEIIFDFVQSITALARTKFHQGARLELESKQRTRHLEREPRNWRQLRGHFISFGRAQARCWRSPGFQPGSRGNDWPTVPLFCTQSSVGLRSFFVAVGAGRLRRSLASTLRTRAILSRISILAA